MASPPVERKVQASSAAAAASGLALWALGRYVFRGAIPDAVTSWIYAAVPGVLAFAAGYLARHTPRDPVPGIPLPGTVPPLPEPEYVITPPDSQGPQVPSG